MKWSDSHRVRLMLVGLIAGVVLGGIGLANGATITVGPGPECDFDTIQAGIDAANDGDTVLVALGEFVITEPITFRGKAVTVKSETGSDETTIRMGTPADTNRASVVIFENGETDDSILDGFTIDGGRGSRLVDSSVSFDALVGGGICFDASSGTVSNCNIMQNTAQYGGGISCWDNALVAISNCTIEGNSATVRGGGVFCGKQSSLILTDCAIKGNSVTGATVSVAGYGGGVSCTGNSLSTLTNCNIADNSAGVGGGGMFFYGSPATVAGCTISGNSGGLWGGGVGCEVDGTRLTMTNCVIARNTAGDEGGGGVACALFAVFTFSNCTIWGNSGGSTSGGGGLACWSGASGTVTNSIVRANTSPKGPEIAVAQVGGWQFPSTLTVAYSNVAGGQAGAYVESGHTLNWGGGNIDADPCFADPANDDVHLQSQAGRWDNNSRSWVQDEVTSPCIDAGDPVSDWRAELWPHGIRTNMGAHGGTLQASRSLSDAGNIADLNRDGIVDSADIRMMVDHWDTDEPYCDIAPAPFGDGIVDVQDLVILAENLFEEYDYRMMAHWKLDETAGSIAHDSARENDGTVMGLPLWQPDGGVVGGALELDGMDDYVSTPFVWDPADGAFSVFTWIKAGAPGQVIISQTDGLGSGETWLGLEPLHGKLMTGLVPPSTGRFITQPLVSEFIMTDGQWYHIGFVWDGSYRFLYVDGTEVTKDAAAVAPLKSSDGGLHIGTSKNLDKGTFFFGLIDDVRIYDVALSPEEIAPLAQ